MAGWSERQTVGQEDQGSSGWVVRAPDCRSRGPGFQWLGGQSARLFGQEDQGSSGWVARAPDCWSRGPGFQWLGGQSARLSVKRTRVPVAGWPERQTVGQEDQGSSGFQTVGQEDQGSSGWVVRAPDCWSRGPGFQWLGGQSARLLVKRTRVTVAGWSERQTVGQEDQGSSGWVVRGPDCWSRGPGFQWLGGQSARLTVKRTGVPVAGWSECQTVGQEDQGSSGWAVRAPDCRSRGPGFQWLGGQSPRLSVKRTGVPVAGWSERQTVGQEDRGSSGWAVRVPDCRSRGPGFQWLGGQSARLSVKRTRVPVAGRSERQTVGQEDQGSSGWVVRAPDCRSRGPGFQWLGGQSDGLSVKRTGVPVAGRSERQTVSQEDRGSSGWAVRATDCRSRGPGFQWLGGQSARLSVKRTGVPVAGRSEQRTVSQEDRRSSGWAVRATDSRSRGPGFQWLGGQSARLSVKRTGVPVAGWSERQTVSQEDRGSSGWVVRATDCRSRGPGFQWLDGQSARVSVKRTGVPVAGRSERRTVGQEDRGHWVVRAPDCQSRRPGFQWLRAPDCQSRGPGFQWLGCQSDGLSVKRTGSERQTLGGQSARLSVKGTWVPVAQWSEHQTVGQEDRGSSGWVVGAPDCRSRGLGFEWLGGQQSAGLSDKRTGGSTPPADVSKLGQLHLLYIVCLLE